MELTNNDLIQIGSYFNHTLPETDKQDFQKRLAADADFRRAVYEFQATAAVLNTVRERQQKAFLQGIDATMPPFKEKTPIRWLNPTWWAMAATGLVLVTAGIWFFSQNTEGGLKSVAKDYFEPYPALGIDRSDDVKTIKRDALVKYARKEYKQAIPLLDKAFAMGQDSILLFYKSNAYLANGEAEAAIPLLEQLQSASFLSHQSVNWYLALAYIETKRREKAVILLKNIENTEGGYQTKAKALLEKL